MTEIKNNVDNSENFNFYIQSNWKNKNVQKCTIVKFCKANWKTKYSKFPVHCNVQCCLDRCPQCPVQHQHPQFYFLTCHMTSRRHVELFNSYALFRVTRHIISATRQQFFHRDHVVCLQNVTKPNCLVCLLAYCCPKNIY